MSEALVGLWKAICDNVRQRISPDAFQRWFSPTGLVEAGEEALVIAVPNQIHQYWIESNYSTALQDAIVGTLGDRRLIRFSISPVGARPVVSDGAADVAVPKPVVKPGAMAHMAAAAFGDEGALKAQVPANGMNPRYLFDTFVVGASNQFAHAASKAVAENPARIYNPLFIHGGTGLGKTHLMHAIGQHIVANRKKAKVVYVSSESFTNDFIDALQQGTLVKFRRRFRQADILLIDDVQFFAGKERSQEEFFHTFNHLFNDHKQIVMTSDRPPSEMAKLEARLVSRFEWGIAAEMQAPDVETRIAILRKKMALWQAHVPEDIVRFLAERISNNVRRLEGALMRVASFASLSGDKISVTKVEELTRDLLQEDALAVVTIDKIQRVVAEHFDVRLADMTSKRRPACIAFPRQIAMYLAREMTQASFAEIGSAFGGRDHGTAMHACKLVNSRSQDDPKLRSVLTALQARLKN